MRSKLIFIVLLISTVTTQFHNKAFFTPLSRGGGRILGGIEAEYGEFPHQIALLRGGVGGTSMCSGSLLSPTEVVTAGHCCDGQTANNLGVRVGNYHLYEDDPDQADIGVAMVLLHEDYDSWTVENDICLLKLESEADFSSPAIGAITLPADGQEYAAGTECVVSGWGITTPGEGLPQVLMKVTLPIVSDDDCREAYGLSEISDSMICAGLEQGGKDACQGDSGGPLMCGFELSGLISWGYGCAQAGFPGVYTQTSYFVSWLNSHME